MNTKPCEKNWVASLDLVFEKKNNKTVLTKNQHYGPLLVQKPLYPEKPEVCHVYLIHPPGGVVHGDQLSVNVQIQPQAHSLITTPAAGKFYRSNGEYASLVQQLTVHDNACLEWLPQETLLFNASQVHLKTIISLKKDARFIGWEILCLGRKASNEPYTEGHCHQNFEVWRADQPIFIERSQFDGNSSMLHETWGMNGHPLTATMIATHCTSAHLKTIQELAPNISSKGLFSVTLKQDILICRFLGEQAEHARAAFIKVWQTLRPSLLQQPTIIPRIWNT